MQWPRADESAGISWGSLEACWVEDTIIITITVVSVDTLTAVSVDTLTEVSADTITAVSADTIMVVSVDIIMVVSVEIIMDSVDIPMDSAFWAKK